MWLVHYCNAVLSEYKHFHRIISVEYVFQYFCRENNSTLERKSVAFCEIDYCNRVSGTPTFVDATDTGQNARSGGKVCLVTNIPVPG